MSQTNHKIMFAGLDVAKSSLQLHWAGKFHCLTNDAAGWRRLLKLLAAQPGVHVICEATGGYEQAVVEALQAATLAVSVVEAGRVRHFARAKGLRAKTDPIDAAVLTQYGQAFHPASTAAVEPRQRQLSALAARRRQLIDLKIIEQNRAGHYADGFSKKQSRQLLALLEKQIEQCDQQIAQLIEQDPLLNSKAQRLKTIPGVGSTTAASVLADMPELGCLSPSAAAALAGVAPYDRQSGHSDRQRHIGGGRKSIRCALYMATLSAVRHDRILREFYQRLRTAGKPAKLALTACMRKLIMLMNRLIKNPQFSLAT